MRPCLNKKKQRKIRQSEVLWFTSLQPVGTRFLSLGLVLSLHLCGFPLCSCLLRSLLLNWVKVKSFSCFQKLKSMRLLCVCVCGGVLLFSSLLGHLAFSLLLPKHPASDAHYVVRLFSFFLASPPKHSRQKYSGMA